MWHGSLLKKKNKNYNISINNYYGGIMSNFLYTLITILNIQSYISENITKFRHNNTPSIQKTFRIRNMDRDASMLFFRWVQLNYKHNYYKETYKCHSKYLEIWHFLEWRCKCYYQYDQQITKYIFNIIAWVYLYL